MQRLMPAPASLLQPLMAQGLIAEGQSQMAQRVPMCDALTVEADSSGHTDNRPLVCLLPSILELRDELQAKHGYERIVYIGSAAPRRARSTRGRGILIWLRPKTAARPKSRNT